MNNHTFFGTHRYGAHLVRALFTVFLSFLMAFSTVGPLIPAQAASGNMQITPIDFGDAGIWGDSTMLSSGGKNLLMDTYIRDDYDTLINYLDDHHFYTFDLYLSHYHYDHMDQFTAIIEDSRFNVGTVYLPDPAYLKKGAQSTGYCQNLLNGHDNIVNAAKSNGCKIVYLKKGSSFTVGSATVKVLWGCSYSSSSYDASYINNNSLVTKVTSGTVSYLTCGDIEAEVENQLVASGINLSADIFKFNHHGGNSSNTSAFVKKVNPSFAYYNWLGDSPTSFGGGWVQTPINNLKNTCNIYSTRYNGMLTFTVKAGHISVAGERNMLSVNVNITDSSGKVVNTVNYQFNDALDYHITSAMKSTAATVSASNATTALPTRYAYLAKFIETSGGTKYRNKDGSYSTSKFQTIDGDTYYFDENGYVVTGFRKIDGKTYYFDSDGKMLLRWKRINGKKYYFDPTSGYMHTGWEWVSEKNALYYLSPQTGYLLEGWLIYKGKKYYLALNDYYAVTGWNFISGKWYYFDPQNAYMKTGWLTVGGKTYYLGTDGAMVTGTKNIDGKTYTFASNGVLNGQAPASTSVTTTAKSSSAATVANGWSKVNGYWKYGLNGRYITSSFQKINGYTYYLDANGNMLTGFQNIGGKTYYFDASGKMLVGWKRIDGKKYYFDPTSGYMHTGWIWVPEKSALYYLSPDHGYLLEGWLSYKGKKYYLALNNYYAVTGWNFISGKWYYFDPKNAYMKTGWLTLGNKTYYLDTNGAMVTGTKSIGGKTYTFASNGVLSGSTGGSTAATSSASATTTSSASAKATSSANTTGWVKENGYWRYLLNGQYVKSRFQKVGDSTYYFNGSGNMLTSWQNINGKWYYFDASGKALTGWQKISGKWYYFDPSTKVMKTGWLTLGTKTYYLNSKGVMLTGSQIINGKIYTFAAGGALTSGTAPSTTSTASSQSSASTKITASSQSSVSTQSSASSQSSANSQSSVTTASQTHSGASWNMDAYVTAGVTDTWAKRTDSDMTLDYSTKRSEAFVNNMLAYATYFVDKIDYASSVTGDDPTGLRFQRLWSGGKTDCSWFVYHVLYKFGLVGEDFIHSYQWGNDPSTYPGGVNIGTDVSKASPGDIICTGKGTASSNSHVMIYLGGGKVVECAAGYGVIISDAPSSARQVVHYSCLPTNTGASYKGTTSGTWYKSGSSYSFKVGSSYLTNRFQNINGEIYYFDKNGHCVTGWQTIDGKKYYFQSGGQMYLRWKRIDGKKYYFDPETGYMHTGWEWVSENNGWYYLDPSTGYLVTGWKDISGKTYYFDTNGKMVTGTQSIGGKTYTFGQGGALIK